jgi:mono/diheme cytochrome c family protein
MTMNNTSLFLAVGLASSLALPSARAAVDFVTQVAPVLEKHCVECHGAEKSKGKLRLDSRAAAFNS